jgi:hypothetical protein
MERAEIDQDFLEVRAVLGYLPILLELTLPDSIKGVRDVS